MPPPDTEPARYISYVNSTHSIQIVKYPDNWILVEPADANVTEVAFYSPNYDASVSVGYFDVMLPAISSGEFGEYRVNELKKRVTLFSLVSSNATTLAGEPAHMIVYKGHLQLIGDKLFPYQLMEIYATSGGRVYAITYGTLEELFPTYLPLAQNMIDSFEPARADEPTVLVGTFDNLQLGLHVDLPEKWTGVHEQESGVTTVFATADDSSLDSDYSSMQIIFGTRADLDAHFAKSDASVKCTSDRTIEVVRLEGAKALRYETLCDADEYAKYYTYFMPGKDQNLIIFYNAPTESVYRASLEKFHTSVASIQFAYALDVSDINEYARYSGLESQSFRVKVGGEDFDIPVATNSSITNFEFSEQDKKLSITLDGKDGTSGETYLEIGRILQGEYDVLIDGEVVNETDNRVQVVDDQTTNQTFISVTYTHSEHSVTIIGTNVVPEFPVPATLMASLAVVAVVVFVLTKANGSRMRAGDNTF
jgi:hypothetical protein